MDQELLGIINLQRYATVVRPSSNWADCFPWGSGSKFSYVRLFMEEILHHSTNNLSHCLQGIVHHRWLAGFLNHQQYHKTSEL